MLQALRERQFLVAGQERDRAHLPKIEAERVVRTVGILILAGWTLGRAARVGGFARRFVDSGVVVIIRIEVIRIVVSFELGVLEEFIFLLRRQSLIRPVITVVTERAVMTNPTHFGGCSQVGGSSPSPHYKELGPVVIRCNFGVAVN